MDVLYLILHRFLDSPTALALLAVVVVGGLKVSRFLVDQNRRQIFMILLDHAYDATEDIARISKSAVVDKTRIFLQELRKGMVAYGLGEPSEADVDAALLHARARHGREKKLDLLAEGLRQPVDPSPASAMN